MSITITSNFTLNTNLALDDRAVVADNTARDAIGSTRRYLGMTVFVLATLKFWQLQAGITNGDWVDITASSAAVTASNGLTAFAGGGQASATALPSKINRVTTVATAADSVKLPAATAGSDVLVINDGANSMNVYPQTGESIDSLAVNAAYAQSILVKGVRYVCSVAGLWRALPFARPRTATSGITAFAGGGQASATALVSDLNRVTTVATAGDSVKLPAAVPGLEIVVINDGAASLNIYPVTGESIDALAANAAYALTTTAFNVRLICVSAGLWKSAAGGGSSGPTIFGSTGSPRSVANTGITAAASHMSTTAQDQLIFVTTAGGEIDIISNPQIQAHTVIGATMEIHGTSDVNWLFFETGTGLSINGEWRSYADKVLGLRWNGTNWVERYRS